MDELTLRSPAKVNLFLRIVRRRPDGFHELASLFQAISLYDTLRVQLSDRDQLTCSLPGLPTDGTNLVLRAADLFRRKTGIQTYAAIHLEKRIPLEAGLGGGSSNAATTLWALNELTERPANIDQLRSWAAEIGSDVAFFLSEGTAYCTGRGEIMRQLPASQPRSLCIAKPRLGLSTKLVYQQLKAEGSPPRDPEKTLATFLSGGADYYNDLEAPAFQLLPSLKQLKEQLQECGFDHVLMSGSGTSFFCVGEGQLPSSRDLDVFPVHFTNRTLGHWY